MKLKSTYALISTLRLSLSPCSALRPWTRVSHLPISFFVRFALPPHPSMPRALPRRVPRVLPRDYKSTSLSQRPRYYQIKWVWFSLNYTGKIILTGAREED